MRQQPARSKMLREGGKRSSAVDWHGQTERELHDQPIKGVAEEQITQAGLDGSSAKLFPAGTVLLAMYGATIGATAVLGKAATTNQACCAFLVSDTKGLDYYCFQWLQDMKEALIGMGMGAAQPNLSQDLIRKIDFLLPPESLLSDFDDYIGTAFKQIATLTQQNENLRQARDLLLPRLMSGEVQLS